MSELAVQMERYLAELVRGANSSHTVDAYAADLREFLHYLSPPETEPPAPGAINGTGSSSVALGGTEPGHGHGASEHGKCGAC